MKNVLAVFVGLAFVASTHAQSICQTRTSSQFRAGSARYVEIPQYVNPTLGVGAGGGCYDDTPVVAVRRVAIVNTGYYNTGNVGFGNGGYYGNNVGFNRNVGFGNGGHYYNDNVGFNNNFSRAGRGNFGGGRGVSGGGGGNGGFAANALDTLLSPQGILTIGGAAGGAALAGPLGAPAGAAIGSALGQVLGAGIQNGGNTGRRR